nr:MAG: phosphoprotein [Wenzhou rodent jeilongvirus 1]
MSDYLSEEKAKSIENGIKILEELAKERESKESEQSKGTTGEPTPKKRARSRGTKTQSGNKNRSPIPTAWGSESTTSGESGDWEKVVHSARPDGPSGEPEEQQRPGGSDNTWDGSSSGRDDSRDGEHGGDRSRESVSDSGVASNRESESNDGGASGGISVSDIEKILSLDDDVDTFLETGVSEQGVRISDADPAHLEDLLNAPPSNVHRRLRGVKDEVADITIYDHGGNAIKRGIVESTVSTTVRTKSLYARGATRSAPESHPQPDSTSVSADYVPTLVESVNETDITSLISRYEDSRYDLREMLSLTLAKVDMVMVKLKDLDKLSREVNEVKRVLDNFGVAIATLESYMESMMIVIPSSGKTSEMDTTETNPDLRPVIGRDRARGYAEIIEKKVTFDDIKIDDIIDPKQSVDKEYLNFDLDFTQNNASNFIPTQDDETMNILLGMIDDHVKDNEQARLLKAWITEKSMTFPLDELYTMVVDTIEPGGEKPPE